MEVRSILAYVAAGAAAVLTRLVMMRDAADAGRDDSTGVRLVVATAFFGVLLAIDRRAFQPVKAVDLSEDEARRRAIREYLTGLAPVTVLIPLIFYLRFGSIGPLGWGLCVFFDVYCLLVALGLYFGPRTDYHSPVQLHGDWLDRMGGFWLVACAFGPFLGWVVTEAWPLTASSWHWRYAVRGFLAAGLPLVLALPLLRYARGKSRRVALPLLVLITLLPVSTAVRSMQDLLEGPVVRQVRLEHVELYLSHTERVIDARP